MESVPDPHHDAPPAPTTGAGGADPRGPFASTLSLFVFVVMDYPVAAPAMSPTTPTSKVCAAGIRGQVKSSPHIVAF